MEIKMAEVPAAEPLMLDDGILGGAAIDISKSAGVVVGKHPAGHHILELSQCLFELRVRGIDGTHLAAGLFRDLEMIVEFPFVGVIDQVLIAGVEHLELADHSVQVSDFHNALRHFAAHNGAGGAVTAGT